MNFCLFVCLYRLIVFAYYERWKLGGAALTAGKMRTQGDSLSSQLRVS